MNKPTVRFSPITNPRLGFKGKHRFALVLCLTTPDPEKIRYAGLDSEGTLTWTYLSAPKAHRAFRWYVPGEWFNYPAGEKVLSVHLYRQDGKTWHKDASSEQSEFWFCHFRDSGTILTESNR